MKKKDKQVVVGIIFIVVLGFILSSGGFPLAIGSSQESVGQLELEGCKSISECKNNLLREGMPENFLEESNSEIFCELSKCVLRKQ